MINASKEFKEKLNNGANLVNYADITLADGTALNLTYKDFMVGGCVIEDKTTDGKFGVGFCVGKTLTMRIANHEGQFTGYDFYNAAIRLYVAMALDDGTVEKIRKGTYYVTVPSTTGEVIEISAVDAMHRLDKDYAGSATPYPASLQRILSDACLDCGIQAGFTQFDNMDFVVQEKPEETTYRQVVSYAAQIAGYNVLIDSNGYMQLVWYDTSLLINPDPAPTPFTLDVHTDDVQITGVRVSDGEEEYLFGEEGYLIELKDNPFVAGNIKAVADYLGRRMVGMVFRPFTAQILNNPLYEPFEVVSISGRKGNTYASIVNSVSYTIGSSTQISCEAEDPVRNGSTYYSEAAQAVVEARRNTKRQLTSYDKAVQNMNQLAMNAMGYHTTYEEQPDGSRITYLHDKPSLEESTIIYKQTIDGFFISQDGGKSYTAGFDAQGNAVLNILYAIGINADWIRTGALTVQDDYGNYIFYADINAKRAGIGGFVVTPTELYSGPDNEWSTEDGIYISSDGTIMNVGSSSIEIDGKRYKQKNVMYGGKIRLSTSGYVEAAEDPVGVVDISNSGISCFSGSNSSWFSLSNLDKTVTIGGLTRADNLLVYNGATMEGTLYVSGKATFDGGIVGDLTGNAKTATTADTAATLKTARTINGTSFNGSANITTSNWGTARNISIADSASANTGTAVSVNGSANVTLKLPATIKANITGNLTGNATTATTATTANSATTATTANSAAKLTSPFTMKIGNTSKSIDGSSSVTWTLSEIGAVSGSYLPLSGGTLTGSLTSSGRIYSDSSVGAPSVDCNTLVCDTSISVGSATRYGNSYIYGGTTTIYGKLYVNNGPGGTTGYLYTYDLGAIGTVNLGTTTIKQTLSVTGATTLSSTLTVSGVTNVNNTLNANHLYTKTASGGTVLYHAIPTNSSDNSGNYTISYINSTTSGLSINGRWGTSSWGVKAISISSSDIRLKTNISDTDERALDTINKIRMRQFDWKESGEHQKLGFVADELEEIDSRFALGGGCDEDGSMCIKSVDTFYLMGYVVKGIQELASWQSEKDRQIGDMRKELEELKFKIT